MPKDCALSDVRLDRSIVITGRGLIRHNSVSELLSRVKIHVFQHHIAVKRQRIHQRSRQV